MKSTIWKCPMCTFQNENASSRCEVCKSKRPDYCLKTPKLSQYWLSEPMDKKQRNHCKMRKAFCAQKEIVEVIESSDSEDSNNYATMKSANDSTKATKIRRMADNNGKLTETKLIPSLWAESYAPKLVDDLCMSKNKVREIFKWLQDNAFPNSSVLQKRLLFLCGPPGSGKSTAVRCIAQQLGLLVIEWKDNSSAGKISFERMLDEEFRVPQASEVDNFSDFIHRSSTYAALFVEKSRRVSISRRKRRLPNNHDLRGYADASAMTTGQLILIESWPQSRWKDQSLCEERLQRIYQHVVKPVGGFHYPIVCIYSDVQKGSRIDLEHLSRTFSCDVMHSPLTSVICINAVTSAQMKKQLKQVATREKITSQSADLERIIDSSNGDMRHALNMLQLLHTPNMIKSEMVPATANKKEKISSVKISSPRITSARDHFFSDLHIIGKLLHGKILQTRFANNCESKKCQPNDADDDKILAASTMPLDRVLGLLHENSIAYFSQVEDLYGALELMSLCEVLVAESYKGVSCSAASKYSRKLALAILLRAVAITNENPAPKSFRPITRPQTYTVKQRIVLRREEMKAATRGSGYEFQYVCTGDVFAFEVEPFLKIMDQAGRSATWKIENETSINTQCGMDDEIEISDDGW